MRRFCALLAVLALAGCSGSGGTSSSPAATAPQPPDGQAFTEGFESDGLPAGWQATDGAWTVVADADAPQGGRMLQGAGDADPGFSSLLAPGRYGDVRVNVIFTMLEGEHPQGAGVVLNVLDARNYQIVRYSISENSWNLFTVKDGKRDKQPSATLESSTHPDFGTKVALRVESKDGVVSAHDGDVPVLAYTLPAGHPRTGQVGPFVRGDTVARFDAMAVTPL